MQARHGTFRVLVLTNCKGTELSLVPASAAHLKKNSYEAMQIESEFYLNFSSNVKCQETSTQETYTALT